MIKFKVLVIQRGKAFIAYPNDVKRGVVILGTSKEEVLLGSQIAIIDEIRERGELFVPDYKEDIKNIVRKKNVKIEAGDNLTLEEVDIEFTCNDVRLGEIHWCNKKEIKTINLVLISFSILYIFGYIKNQIAI